MRRILLAVLMMGSGLAAAQESDDALMDMLAQPQQTTQESQSATGTEDDGQPRMLVIDSVLGTTLQAYVAGPADSSRALLLLHDRLGLNDTFKAQVRKLAERGYRVLAIDMFDRRQSNKLGLATEILNATDPEAAKADVLAGIRYLKAPGRKIITMGWGFGGDMAYHSTLSAMDDVAAAVVWYAPLYHDIEESRAIKAPILGIFARNDLRVTPEMVKRYEELMRKNPVPFRAHIFEAGFGFADPLYPGYNPVATDEAWQKVDRFIEGIFEGRG